MAGNMGFKNLDEVVIDALKLHSEHEPPALALGKARRRFVVASGNALPTGKIIFAGEEAVFAGEDQYKAVLDATHVESAVVISASGEKHAPLIVKDLLHRGIEVHLLTCNSRSSAASLLPPQSVSETASMPEPITYNTSTYLGMIFAKTQENPRAILAHIEREVAPLIPDMRGFNAFYLIIPSKFDMIREMFVTKFDELFGPMIVGRCYTLEQTLHAKTVIPSDKELFVSFGYKNEVFGTSPKTRLNIPLPSEAEAGTMIAIGYYTIGKIQTQFHPWFKEHADSYKKLQGELFKKILG